MMARCTVLRPFRVKYLGCARRRYRLADRDVSTRTPQTALQRLAHHLRDLTDDGTMIFVSLRHEFRLVGHGKSPIGQLNLRSASVTAWFHRKSWRRFVSF